MPEKSYDYLFRIRPVPGGYYAHLVGRENVVGYGSDAFSAIENACKLLAERDVETPYVPPIPADLVTWER